MQSRQKHLQNNSFCKLWGAKTAHYVGLELFPSISLGTAVTPRPGLLEEWLVLTSVKYQGPIHFDTS